MVTRKRTRAQAEQDGNDASAGLQPVQPPEEQGLLLRIRNMWEFAALAQYLFSFGKYMKIPEEYDIDLLEAESLKPGYSTKLLDLGLTLLRFVSSHRGLTPDNFDEYTRRQYLAKSPSHNPFGDEEEPLRFNDFDILTKIRVLYQLSLWTSWNPDRFRAQMPEQKESQQIAWRIEEFGYDSEDRYYYVLDDNRLYRRTNPPIPAPQSRRAGAGSKRGRGNFRAAKRRRLTAASTRDTEPSTDGPRTDSGYQWECIAVTLEQYQGFVQSLENSDDPNEEYLRDRLIEYVIPIIEKQEESEQRKVKQRERELLNMERLAHAKRSSRIAMKQEQERLKAEDEERQRAQQAELEKQAEQEEEQRRRERERQERLATREKRLLDRERRRAEREKQLARVAEEASRLESGEKRMSERRLNAEIEKRKKTIEELKAEDSWFFDCSGCGLYGENHDDGSHTISCEKCNVWQHSQCLGIRKDEAEREDFHYICADCRRRIEEAKRPKIPPLKFRIAALPSPPEESSRVEQIHVPASHLTSAVSAAQDPRVDPTRPLPNHLNSSGSNLAPSDPQDRQHGVALNTAFSARPSEISQVLSTSASTLSQPAHRDLHAHHAEPPTAAVSDVAIHQLSSPLPKLGHLSSPLNNAPSFAPTQGNHHVGPAAGPPGPIYPTSHMPATAHGGPPWHANMITATASPPRTARPTTLPSLYAPLPAPQAGVAGTIAGSIVVARDQNHNSTHLADPPSSGPVQSGLSPTKHFPVNHTSPSAHNDYPILPPVQELKPSRGLMGQSSFTGPMPPPIKRAMPTHSYTGAVESDDVSQLSDAQRIVAHSFVRSNSRAIQHSPPQAAQSIASPGKSGALHVNGLSGRSVGPFQVPQAQTSTATLINKPTRPFDDDTCSVTGIHRP